MLGSIIGWIVFGLVVGIIARFLMPGPQPMGMILTCLLGVAGSFLGGFLGSLLFGSGAPDASSAAGWIGSIVGALLLLLGYGMMTKRPTGP
jgi:uncharacterized membrane protein YeaQ/YmgE (transglycosylase-associated protein family)